MLASICHMPAWLLQFDEAENRSSSYQPVRVA
jgi:hypothetical protein